MAKGQIALGKFRGKVGGQVLRVDAGIGQIISEYNPHPSNPRTVAQTNQRSKMVLAGKISKITPKGAILGLDSNGRKARSLFVSNILRAATLTSEGGDMAANVLMSELKLSKGVISPVQFTVARNTGSNGLTITAVNPSSAASYGGALIVVYASNNAEWIGCKVYAMSKTDTTKDVLLSDFGLVADSGAQLTVFTIPIIETNAAVTTAYGQILLADGTSVNASVNYFRTIAANNGFGESQFKTMEVWD